MIDENLEINWITCKPAPDECIELSYCVCPNECVPNSCICMDNDLPCTDMCKADCKKKISSLLSVEEESNGVDACEEDMLENIIWIMLIVLM